MRFAAQLAPTLAPILGPIFALTLALLLVIASGVAQAQVFRCEREGKVSYLDHPCELGAKASQKAFTASGPSSSVAMNVSNRFYDVSGLDSTSLSRSMDANGPKGFHGLASWKIDFNYDSAQKADGCLITAVKVNVNGDILMPRWVDEPRASRDMQRSWAESYNKLKRHEDGHVNHGRELALLVKEKLMGLGLQPCEKLKAQAQQSFDQLYSHLKKRDQEYDARTKHGTE